MKTLISLFILLGFFNSKAQETPTLETYTLKNGLKVYLIKYGKIDALNISVMINSGKKNEPPGQQGYNDLTAKLLLKGNKKYTEEQQNDQTFSLGASIASGSGYDYTTIEGDFLTKDAAAAFDLISAAVLQPTFDKGKVEQYISYMIDYNSHAKMDIADLAAIYSNLGLYGLDNPLGRSVYKKQLQAVTPEKLIEFHQFNYTPKNTRIIVCGKYNSEEIKKMIENSFGAWQSAYGEVNGVSIDGPSIKKKECAFVNRTSATQCALRWTKTGPALKDKDYLAFTIANQLFNQTLFKEIREKGGKTYSIGSQHHTSQFSNVMAIGCSVRNNELLNTVGLFDKTLQDFALGNFTQQEFDNEITSYKTQVMSMEYPSQIADYYNPVVYSFEARKNMLNEIARLTPEDIRKVIKKYYTPNIYYLTISGPESEVTDQLAKIPGLKKYTPADLELKN